MKSFLLTSSALALTLAVSSPCSAAPPQALDYMNHAPALVGSVTASGDHSVTLATDTGESVALVIDSRSVVPTTLPTGTRVRVEFHALSADVFHARRITPLTSAEIRAEEEGPRMRASSQSTGQGTLALGREEGEPTTTGQTMAEAPTGASSESMGQGHAAPRTESATGARSATAATGTAATDEHGVQTPPGASTGSTEPVSDELPRTSSPLPLAGAIGILALAAAGIVGLTRRRSRA